MSRLYSHGHDEAEGAHRARLPAVPLPGLSAAVPRADRPPVHRSPGPDRQRAARRALASPREARLRGQPRADPRLGGPRRPAARGSAAREAGAATPAAPDPWTRPTCTSPGAGALALAPSTARGGSSPPCAARPGTRMLPGASCGAWSTWPSARRRASRRRPLRPTGGRSAGSWGARCDTDAINPCPTASSRTTGPSRSALARCAASGDSRLLCGAVPRSLRADRTAASVNDGVRRSRWPSSDGSSSRAGGQ